MAETNPFGRDAKEEIDELAKEMSEESSERKKTWEPNFFERVSKESSSSSKDLAAGDRERRLAQRRTETVAPPTPPPRSGTSRRPGRAAHSDGYVPGRPRAPCPRRTGSPNPPRENPSG